MECRQSLVKGFYDRIDEERLDFAMSQEDFDSFAAWYLTIAEKRELLGGADHLLCILRKK